ncbi:nucleotidyltransferase family protein [Candidatus Kaiserbacteria bacterium]|nr:nucleotidyltransferase family protein [Candidatus Kaiserbacteria bacterium]
MLVEKMTMRKDMNSFPESFPSPDEELLLRVLLSPDEELAEHYAAWKSTTVFDAVPYAVLGLMPLLYIRLSKHGIVDELTPRLHGIYKYAWTKNQLLIAEVRTLLEVLNATGVSSVVLKGVPLLLTVYKDVGARFLGDVDVLIHGHDAPTVLRYLTETGWTYKDPAIVPEGTRFGLDTVIHATPLTKPGGLELEVHWHVYHVETKSHALRLLTLGSMSHAQPDDAYHWEHAVLTTVRDVPTRMLSPEDFLVHIISHGADGNSMRPFRWVVDAVWLIRAHATLDWQEVVRAAEVADRSIDVSIGLRYLAERGFANIPETVIRELAEHPVSALDARRYRRRTTVSKSLLGNFPLLWYRYFKFESNGTVYGFPSFLARQWGLKSALEVPGYVTKKYTQRLGVHK